jgi:spermidine synthase
VLNQTSDQFDVVILDAYVGESAPSHLLSKEAFASVRRALNPGGVFIISTSGSTNSRESFLIGSLYKTLTAIFEDVRVHDTRTGNAFFVASKEPLPNPAPPDLETVPASAQRFVEAALNRRIEPDFESGTVLTDDYNPVDFFEAGHREAIRRRILEYLQVL